MYLGCIFGPLPQVYSLLLPLTTIIFSMPLLGRYRESAYASTYYGLGVVMLGFAGWRYFGTELEPGEPSPKPRPHKSRPDAASAASSSRSSRRSSSRGAGAGAGAPGALTVPGTALTHLSEPLLAAGSADDEEVGSALFGSNAAGRLSGGSTGSSAAGSRLPSPTPTPLASPPASFQERIVGMGRIARRALAQRELLALSPRLRGRHRGEA